MAKFKSLYISLACLMSLQIATYLNANTFINEASYPDTISSAIDSDLTTSPYMLCRTGTALGIYVSSINGNDSNPGTIDAPVKTIFIGYAIAVASGIPSVYLEAGSTFTGYDNKDIMISNIDILFEQYNVGAKPVIDLENDATLFLINSNATATLRNLEIRNGYANNPQRTIRGGAIYNAGSLYTFNCTFSNNVAIDGGAIYTNAPFEATSCQFINNRTLTQPGMGGAIASDFSSSITINDCLFEANTGLQGGSISAAYVNVYDSTFNHNSTDLGGGGAAILGFFINASGCTFKNNSATVGGAIVNADTSSIHCCRFVDNTATSSGNAICSLSGTVDATNNWWGTNTPEADNLVFGSVTIDPWIVLSLSIDPAYVTPGHTTTFLATFSSNCIPDGIPVVFSTTDGTITPTLATTNNGIASGLLTLSNDGSPFEVTAEVAPTAEAFSLSLTVTPYIPSISVIKLLDGNYSSTTWPGIVVAPFAEMNISYLVKNTSPVRLTQIQVTDDQGYDITQLTTTLDPNETTTCTAVGSGPDETQIHKNIGTVTATTPDSLTITASATAYALSTQILPYRFNWGCTCNDTEAKNFLIGSNNSEDLTDNKIEGWIFDESATSSLQQITSLDLGSDVILNSAVYNNDDGMNIAILTHRQDGTSYVILATATAPTYAFISQSTTQISSIAFKLQWIVAPDGAPYIITDEYSGLHLYAVNLNNYTLTQVASTPNLASGEKSLFLYWLLQGTDVYVIQGYNRTNVATYKVNFAIPSIETGVANDMSDDFAAVSACSTCADYLALGGTTNLQRGAIRLYSVDESGNLSGPTVSRDILNTFIIFYCERCCCTNNNLLVATNNGLYCLDTESLETVASNTSMPNNVWINTCWCCSETPTICTAVNTLSSPFIFKKEGTNLNKIYDL